MQAFSLPFSAVSPPTPLFTPLLFFCSLAKPLPLKGQAFTSSQLTRRPKAASRVHLPRRRLWFGDLHDNISASAIERYTIRQESPWLLKAEMSIVQV